MVAMTRPEIRYVLLSFERYQVPVIADDARSERV